MRKWWILALSALLLFAFPALAEDGVTVSCADETLFAGGETTLTFTVDENSGFAGMVMDVSYDADAFTVKSAQAGRYGINAVNPAYDEGVVRAVFANALDMTDTKEILTLTLVSKGEKGEFPVRCAFTQAVDTALEEVSIFAEDAQITVKENKVETLDAAYDQKETLCPGSAMDKVKKDLTVKATYTDETVDPDYKNYTITGELTVGECVLTVSDENGASDTITVQVSDHDWDEGTATRQPTKTQGGEITYVCSICEGTRVETVALPKSITLSDTALTLGVGMTKTLTVTPNDAGLKMYTFTSSAKSVSVSASGVVSADKAGTATVTVKSVNGKTAKCKVTVMAKPTTLQISGAPEKMNVSDTAKLTVGLTPAKSYNLYDIAIEPEGIVTLENGVLTAVGEGTATVRCAIAEYGLTDSFTVSVLPKPETVLVESPIEVDVKNSVSIDWSVPDGTFAHVAFASADKKIATVDANGVVKGVKGGETDITVTGGKQSATVHVVVVPAVSSVKFKQTKATIGEGETTQLVWTIAPANARQDIVFTSNKETVATVDPETGLITAHAAGTAKITGKAGGKSATFTVTVKKLATEITLTLSDTDLITGESAKATTKIVAPKGAVATPELVSDNPSVASVDGMTVKAVGAGTARIKAVWPGHETNEVTVTVRTAATAVRFSEPETTLYVGEKIKYPAAFNAGETDAVTLTSSDKKILSVAKDGTVTAKKAGTATLTLTTAINKAQSEPLTVTVIAAPKSIKLFADEEQETALKTATIAVGEEVLFTSVIAPADANQKVLVTSNNENVRVEQNEFGFTVTGEMEGTATVTVQSAKKTSVKTTLKVTVKKAPETENITVKPSSKTVKVGKTVTFSLTYDKGYGAFAVTWSCDNPEVMTIDEKTGKATVLAQGEVTVTATLASGVTATYSVGGMIRAKNAEEEIDEAAPVEDAPEPAPADAIEPVIEAEDEVEPASETQEIEEIVE